MNKKKQKPKLPPKWSGNYTTIKKHYKHIIFPIGGVALVGVTVAAIFLPLYIKQKAEDEFDKFVSQDGPNNDLSKTAKIKYVALGDSISAGYDGILGRDFVSFADFIAADLKKAGRLSGYKNFSTTGDKIWDTYNNTILSPANTHAIQDANLITITLGSNDLMVAVRLLRTNLKAIMPGHGGSTANPLRTFIDKNAEKGVTTEETLKLVDESLEQLENAIRNKNFAGVLSLIPEYEQTIFDLIKRNLLIMDRDLHQAAPNAKIVFLSPYLPFQNMPDSIITGKVEENGNKTVGDFYQKFVDVFSSVAGYNNFTEHIAMKDLPSFKANIEDKDNYIEPYGLKVPRALPNIADIHPSTYGHELMGNDLFDIFAKKLGIDKANTFHTHGRKANNDDVYEIYDETTNEFSPEYYDESKNVGVNWDTASMVKQLMDTENGTSTLQEFIANNVDKVLDMFLDSKDLKSYVFDSSKTGFANQFIEKADGIAQEIPSTGTSLVDDVRSGKNKTLNVVGNTIINLLGMMTDAQSKSTMDTINNKLAPFKPLKLKVKEKATGTISEIDASTVSGKFEILGITRVDTKRWSMSEYNSNQYVYNGALESALKVQESEGISNYASTDSVIKGDGGDIPDFNFKELGFEDLGNYEFVDSLIGKLGSLFGVEDQVKNMFDLTSDEQSFTAHHIFEGIFSGDFSAFTKVANVNPGTDINALEDSLSALKDKVDKDWSWMPGLASDFTKYAKEKNDDDFTFTNFITYLYGLSSKPDGLKDFSDGTKAAFEKDPISGDLVHQRVLINYIMASFNYSWAEIKEWPEGELIDEIRFVASSAVKLWINDDANTEFKPLKELFLDLDKGAKRLADLLSD